MTIISPIPWLQNNWDFVDLSWNLMTKEEMEHTIDVVNNLPISEHTESIIQAVKDSIVTIIEAETWSGKTTQVPKILSKAIGVMKKIIVTEPRVIAAIWAARRVSKELMSFTKDPKYSIWHEVWYRTWKEKLSVPDTKITFVTDWLQLLRQFVSKLSPDLLIVDEVHTYSVATEFLLALIKKEMEETRKKIKLILMSATIDTELMKSFFSEVKEVEKAWIPILDIPWRTFPVEKEYKKWEDFIPSIIELAKQDKNVLVFVDGKKEIDITIEELNEKLPKWKYNIVPLHSELTVDEQTQVLNHPDRPTIVVATNIAQESITLDYINAVVDNWYCKTLKVNRNWVPELVREPISKADAMQRAWRAWRVMPWTYVWANNISFDNLDDFPAWEIENITLERYVLISLAVWFDPMKELRKAWTRRKVFIHDPNKHLLKLSYDNLRKMWAINASNKLTELWEELLNYPLDPKIAIMLLNWVNSGCTWNMIDICAILNHNSFIWKWLKWKEFVKGTYKQDSDLIGLSEFLKLVTTREPLKSEVVSKLKKEWVNPKELELFAQYSNNGKEKMLFEIVDLSIIGVKPKKLFEILKTIETLKERLKETGIDISRKEYENHKDVEYNEKEKIKKDNENLTRNIVRSILSWISDNIFEWKKNPDMNDEWMFYNPKLGRFNPPINTLMKDFSKNSLYTWFPFIIGSSKKDEDIQKWSKKSDWRTPLLFFITEVNEWDIWEVNHAFLLETFKDIKFGYKEVWRTKRWKIKLAPRVIANMWIDSWWLSLSSIIAEIQKEKLEDVISFTWLPDFMLENNLAVKKYIRSYRKKQKFNLARFRELLTLFTPTLYPIFDMKNLERTLNSYIHDSSVFDAFYRSEDPRIKEFKENPYMEEYKDDVVWKRRKETIDKKLEEKQKALIEGISAKREENLWWDNELEDDITKKLRKISDKESNLRIRLINQEKARKFKEQMQEEIKFFREEAATLNLNKTEITYYIVQIRKKYKLKEKFEWINNEWFVVNLTSNFAWYISLEIIDTVLNSESKNISFEWLINYMIENNQSIKKFLDSYKTNQKFNLARFKEIVSIFLPSLFDKFYFNNIKKSLNNFKFDSSIIEAIKQSEDPRVIEYLADPCKKTYSWKINLKGNCIISLNNMPLFQRELINELREKREYAISKSNNSVTEDTIEVESELAEQKFDKQEWKAFKERRRNLSIRKKKSNTNRELEILEMRQEIRKQRESFKAWTITKIELQEVTKIIEEKYNYTRRVRKRNTKEKVEEPIELSNLQKMNLEIDALKEEMKPLLRLKKEDWWITKEDLRKMINDIKAKYWMIKTRQRKKQTEEKVTSKIVEEPKKVVKRPKKTKLEYMREAIDNFILESKSNNKSQEEIDAWVEKIELKFWYKKPEVQKANVSTRSENKAVKPVEKLSLNQQIQDLKKESKAKWWTKEKYEEKLAELKKHPKK